MTDLSRRDAIMLAGASTLALSLPRAARAQAQPAKAQPEAAARPGPAQDQGAGFYRMKVGSLDAITFTDGFAQLQQIQPTFAPEATPEELKQTLADALEPTDRLSLNFNLVAVKAAEGWVLFDAGFGPGARSPALGRLLENMAAAGLKKEDISAVFITHAHGDHLAGVLSDDQPTFPNARVVIGKTEHDFWMNATLDQLNPASPEDTRRGAIESTRKTLSAIKPKLELVAPGDKLFKQIEFIDTSGHTPGHLSALIADGSDSLCVVGDVAHHHVLMFAKPDWSFGFDVSPKAAVAARKKAFDRFAADRTRLSIFHLPWPGLGRIGKHGTSYWWAPEAWSWKAS